MLTTLVTGATGLLGPYIARGFAEYGPVVTTSRSDACRPCDLLEGTAVRTLIDDVAPDVVVHAAALTDVDRCEREPALARAVNVGAVQNLVEALSGETQLVYISTDQVYPDSEGPHGEEGAAPVNTYGTTKLRGEEVALRHAGTLVLRTNFFGASLTPGRQSLSDFVAESLRRQQKITLFSDVKFNPLHALHLTSAVSELVRIGATGVINLGASTPMSKEQFGREVARHLGLDDGIAASGSSVTVAGRAPRPHDMWMSVQRAEAALGRALPTLREEIELL